MAYKVIILYQLYMPSYFLGTFTEYPRLNLYRRSITDKLRERIDVKSEFTHTFKVRRYENVSRHVQYLRRRHRM